MMYVDRFFITILLVRIYMTVARPEASQGVGTLVVSAVYIAWAGSAWVASR